MYTLKYDLTDKNKSLVVLRQINAVRLDEDSYHDPTTIFNSFKYALKTLVNVKRSFLVFENM